MYRTLRDDSILSNILSSAGADDPIGYSSVGIVVITIV